MILSSFSLIISKSLLEGLLEPPFSFFEKQSLQKTGLDEVGLKGTSHSLPQEEQVTLVILNSRLFPPSRVESLPENLRPLPLGLSSKLGLFLVNLLGDSSLKSELLFLPLERSNLTIKR